MTSDQFDAHTTADEVLQGIDLHGKTALITGASGGLGAESARALVSRGCEVIIAARDLAKTEATIAEIKAQTPQAQLHSVALELGDTVQVQACVEQVLSRFERLDIIIANAGIMATPFGKTVQGFEQQLGVNHIGHFVLVNGLLPAVPVNAGARIVILSSAAHKFSEVELEDPNFSLQPYQPWVAYGRSKTANALFAVALNRRLQTRGITVNAVHPGMIMTELSRYMSKADTEELMARVAKSPDGNAGIKSVAAGAATQVWAATHPSLQGLGGLYLEDCHIASPAAEGVSGGVMPHASDPDIAEALWLRTEHWLQHGPQ